jgi:hypothetical protein
LVDENNQIESLEQVNQINETAQIIQRTIEQIHQRLTNVEDQPRNEIESNQNLIGPVMAELNNLRQDLNATNQQVVFFYEQDFQRQIDRQTDRLRIILNRNLRPVNDGERPQSMREINQQNLIDYVQEEEDNIRFEEHEEDIFMDRNPNHDRYPNHEVSPQRQEVDHNGQIRQNLQIRSINLSEEARELGDVNQQLEVSQDQIRGNNNEVQQQENRNQDSRNQDRQDANEPAELYNSISAINSSNPNYENSDSQVEPRSESSNAPHQVARDSHIILN